MVKIPCGVAVIRRENSFLIAQRKPEDTFGSFWEFPGGRKNPGESFERCVVREAKEELGVDIRVDEKLMTVRRAYGPKKIHLHFYLCTYLSGEPRPLDCQQVRWAGVDELEGFHFPPANGRVIDNLKQRFSPEKEGRAGDGRA